jgi:predicted alpha/beta superfamily hydrolase
MTPVSSARSDIRLQGRGSLLSYGVGPRQVTIWTPPGYASSGDRRYPVLYLHDGQHLLATENEPLGWGLDRILDRLVTERRLAAALVVGIWNTPMRMQEYSPQKAFDRHLSPEQLDAVIRTGFYPCSEPYLDFLVRELKPHVDTTYRTLPGAGHTFTMGASMGAMISAYAVCEYPCVFGGAACMSTHWPIGGGVMIPYLRHCLPDPWSHRFYFDHGTEEMEGQYLEFQKQADSVLQEAGYRRGDNWVTRVFAGHGHSEACWSSRVDEPLRFLLGAP